VCSSTREAISELRKPGQTFDRVIKEMVAQEKRRHLFEDAGRPFCGVQTVTFPVLIEDEAFEFPGNLPEKSQRIVHDRIARLAEDPFPGKAGDKERFTCAGKDPAYRLHISPSYTAFYRIINERIYVFNLMTIEQAHKKYGLL
jgi:mRNA-degrading endonuclease RelE of RelBE toxin-antitoxin system